VRGGEETGLLGLLVPFGFGFSDGRDFFGVLLSARCV
jgi:hypothetical protein